MSRAQRIPATRLCQRLQMAMDPQEVFGAATWVGTRRQKSRQDTRPIDDCAGTWKRKKKKKTAHRGSLSLDKMSLANPGWQPSWERFWSRDEGLLSDCAGV